MPNAFFVLLGASLRFGALAANAQPTAGRCCLFTEGAQALLQRPPSFRPCQQGYKLILNEVCRVEYRHEKQKGSQIFRRASSFPGPKAEQKTYYASEYLHSI